MAGALVSLHRFWQYDVFFYDFGIFDQAVWKVSRFQAPIIEHLAVGGKTIFADHFNPSIFLLSPLYWATSRSEILLITQAVVVAGSALALYAIGNHVLRNRWLSLALTVSYSLFIGLQNAVITDLHEVTIMTLPLMLTFLSIVKKWKRRYFIFLVITLGMKESIFLVGIGLGVFIFMCQKQWRRIAVATISLSILWGIAAIRLIIPYFSDGVYNYAPSLANNALGIIASLVDDPIKRHTLLVSFGSFLFLPLLSPPFWFLIFQDIAARFLPQFSQTRWGLGLHYSAQLAPVLAVASVWGLKRLGRWLQFKGARLLLVLALVANSLWLHYKLHGPLGLAYNPAFYRHTQNFAFLDELIARVPPTGTVMTQNNLAVRFSHRQVLLLRDGYHGLKPDYVVIDTRPGQNPNNFFGLQKKTIQQILMELKRNPDYSAIYQTEQQFIFKKRVALPSSSRPRQLAEITSLGSYRRVYRVFRHGAPG